MIFEPNTSRSVLQRRSSTSIVIQAGALDWCHGDRCRVVPDQLSHRRYIAGLCHHGPVATGALAVVYDHYAIYRSNVGFALSKLFKPSQGMDSRFLFSCCHGLFWPEQGSEQYSAFVAWVSCLLSGISRSCFLRLATRGKSEKVPRAHPAHRNNALIIGKGGGWPTFLPENQQQPLAE